MHLEIKTTNSKASKLNLRHVLKIFGLGRGGGGWIIFLQLCQIFPKIPSKGALGANLSKGALGRAWGESGRRKMQIFGQFFLKVLKTSFLAFFSKIWVRLKFFLAERFHISLSESSEKQKGRPKNSQKFSTLPFENIPPPEKFLRTPLKKCHCL